MSYRSKYDPFWLSIIDKIERSIEEAYNRSFVSIDVSNIAMYGSRSRDSWYGKIIICRDKVVKSSIMVHLRSLARILLSHGLLKEYDSCFSFTVTKNLELIIQKIRDQYLLEGIRINDSGNLNKDEKSHKPTVLHKNYSLEDKIFRNKPLGPKCICDNVFEGFKWHELSNLRSIHLPRDPGVYVIRVIERGDSIINITKRLENIISYTGWIELIEYVRNRLNRLYRINKCPIIYIGSTDSIRSRFKELAGIRHTAFFPVLALLLGKWKLDYGFKTVSTREEALRLEEELKKKYMRIHGFLPALVEK